MYIFALFEYLELIAVEEQEQLERLEAALDDTAPYTHSGPIRLGDL